MHWQMIDQLTHVKSETPKELWENACRYFKFCDDNPIKEKKTLLTGKEAGRKVEVEHTRAYSIEALCLYCGISREYLMSMRNQEEQNEYWHVASKIMYVIYAQAYEYAQVGIFSTVFTMKVLGLDNNDIDDVRPVTVNIVQGLPALSSTESQVLELMESETGQEMYYEIQKSAGGSESQNPILGKSDAQEDGQ